MKFLKKTIVFLFLFFLFYFEPTEIGPITFSQLWKIPFFIFLVYQVLIKRKIKKPSFIKFSYARAGKNLLNGGIFINYLADIIDFIRYMMFPLIYEFLVLKVRRIEKLNYLLLSFAQFVIISGLPFVLGLIETKGRVGFELDDFVSYTGIFQNPHSSSITTATALLVIMGFLKLEKRSTLAYKFNYLLVFFGVYLLFLSYVRTGYAMFAVGLVVLYLPKRLTFGQIISGVLAISVLLVGFFYLLETNELFYNRIFDIRNGNETAAGSGRLIFWSAAVDLWMNGNYFELLFGHGFEGLTNKIYEVTGLKIFAHNEFFTQLGQNGLLGIILLFGFIITLFRFISKRKNMPSYPLSMAVYFLYISLMMTQGGMRFSFDIFMALIFVKLELERRALAGDSLNEIDEMSLLKETI